MRKISSGNNEVTVHNTLVIHGNPMPSNHMLCIHITRHCSMMVMMIMKTWYHADNDADDDNDGLVLQCTMPKLWKFAF